MSRTTTHALLTALILLVGTLGLWLSLSDSPVSASVHSKMASANTNLESLWTNCVYKQLSSLSKSTTTADEGQATAYGTPDWIRNKVNLLYSVQGAKLQQGFKQRPKEHVLIDGVWDPVSHEDADRQRKKYQEMVDILRKNRQKKKEEREKAKEQARLKKEKERKKKEEAKKKQEEEKVRKAEAERKKKEEAEAASKASYASATSTTLARVASPTPSSTTSI